MVVDDQPSTDMRVQAVPLADVVSGGVHVADTAAHDREDVAFVEVKGTVAVLVGEVEEASIGSHTRRSPHGMPLLLTTRHL